MSNAPVGNTNGKTCLNPADLQDDQPTVVTFNDVYDWVIWQFPRLKRGWLCGAVHPPAEEYGWLPAAIHPEKQRLHIHAHVNAPFTSPEAAADWIAAEG